MSVEQSEAADARVDFVVRPDGTVAGDDGASGALAAALPYTGRLARRVESSSTPATSARWRRTACTGSRWG
jgi:hypothetical protein